MEYWKQVNRKIMLPEARVKSPVRVVIIDDDDEFRQRMCGWLNGAGDILVVGDLRGGQEALHRLRQVRPDVVLIDVDAVSAVQVRGLAANAGVIVLHDAEQEMQVLEALRAGALGHLEKPDLHPAQVVAAIRAVSRGQAVLSPSLAGQVLDEVLLRLKRESHTGQEGVT